MPWSLIVSICRADSSLPKAPLPCATLIARGVSICRADSSLPKAIAAVAAIVSSCGFNLPRRFFASQSVQIHAASRLQRLFQSAAQILRFPKAAGTTATAKCTITFQSAAQILRFPKFLFTFEPGDGVSVSICRADSSLPKGLVSKRCLLHAVGFQSAAQILRFPKSAGRSCALSIISFQSAAQILRFPKHDQRRKGLREGQVSICRADSSLP